MCKKLTALFLALFLVLTAAGCAQVSAPQEPVQETPLAEAPPAEAPGTEVPAEEAPAAEGGENWDGEYDVVVIGFGGAGASAAIEAADAGAKVLLVEKAPEGAEGGNTKVSGQQVLSPSDVEAAIKYFDTIFGGYEYDEELLRVTVQGMHDLGPWLEYLGAPELTEQHQLVYQEFPEVPGADTMRCYVLDQKRSDGRMFKILSDAVKARSNIEVWYGSPARELIQDHVTKTITGVAVEHEGQLLEIKANDGVVMACGGYENNQEMIQNYYHFLYAYPKGTIYNTGDGVTMAMKVGAALWHMNNPAGPDLNFKDPESNVYYGYSLAYTLGARSAIYVGPDGTRFQDEATATRHGKVYTNGAYQTAPLVLPAYAVFDEAAFAAGPITTSGGWSADNMAELEKGWILKAETLEELADSIGVPAENLVATVKTYNGYCAEGLDPACGRPAAKLAAISETGPYYAMELMPTLTNTQGGAVRNANCEVVDLDGYAIPHLYSAGEFGSVYVHGYNGGGNVGEAMATGRIAGKNAAIRDKTQIPVISNGKNTPQESQSESEEAPTVLSFVAGTYQGTGRGMGGNIAVEVTVSESSIDSVTITSINDTPGIYEAAAEKLPARILEAQSTNVDVVTGASVTSKGILEAVDDALAQAAK